MYVLRFLFAVIFGPNDPPEEDDDDYGEDWEYGV